MDSYQAVIAGIVAVLAGFTALTTAIGVLMVKIQQLHIAINGNLAKMLDLNEKAADAAGQLKGKAEERSDKQAEVMALTAATVAAKELVNHAADVGKTLIATATLEAARLVRAQAGTAKTLLESTAAEATLSFPPPEPPAPLP
jgi:hypothetical protein